MRAKEKAGFSLVENPGLPSAPIRVCRPVSDQHYTREKAKEEESRGTSVRRLPGSLSPVPDSLAGSLQTRSQSDTRFRSSRLAHQPLSRAESDLPTSLAP